jgi:glycerophosphoryl diester phosphodiesterase
MRKINWQAHRGGAFEAPQNTVPAALYGWSLGAVVEVDVRTTCDGRIIALHNATLAETTDAPPEVRDVDVRNQSYTDIIHYNAAAAFKNFCSFAKVPLLADLFELMTRRSERCLYLDLKDVDLGDLGGLVKKYCLEKQCIFCHCDLENCLEMRRHADIRTMLWIGGSKSEKMERFEELAGSGFQGVDQIQLHLTLLSESDPERWMYDLPMEFLESALLRTAAVNVDLELFPWKMNERCILRMLDMGFTWFCTDYPAKFKELLNKWENGGENERS